MAWPSARPGRVSAIRIDDALAPRPVAGQVRRIEPNAWRLVWPGDADHATLSLDGDGLVVFRDGETWPLELD